MRKMINMVLIFIIGGFFCQDFAYSDDMFYLRVPMNIDKNRVTAIKEYLEGKDNAPPHRLTIDECRQRLLENMRDLRALYPPLQKEFASGLEILKSEGVDAFEKKAYPRIKEASDKVKVKVSAIKTLPAVFGFSEPEMRERLDTFLRQIAEEAKADKVLIWFEQGWKDDFTYTRGFSEQNLLTFRRNLNVILDAIAEEKKPSDAEDEKERERGKVLLKDCGIVSALGVSPDVQKWHHEDTQDNYIRIVIGRSEEYAKVYGELTEQDRTLLTNRLNALIDTETAPWWGIRDYLNSNQYRDFDTFMMVLRHNGSVDIFDVGISPFIYRYLQYYIDKVKANDSESQKWLDRLIGDVKYSAEDTGTIERMETFLQLLETGTDFKTRNIAQHLNRRILSFSKEAEAKVLEYIVDLTGEDLFTEHCDLKLLDVVTDNLIQNAIKYTSHGKIMVRVSKKSVEYQHRGSKQILSAVIEIEDTGIGIPKEEQSAIFGRGYRASNVGDIQGTGIGLDVAYTIVHIMHGDLQLESKIGEGTKITVYLPLVEITALENALSSNATETCL